MATEDGASGVNYKEICPVCGKERGENCMDVEDLIICPNQEECGNNKWEKYNAKEDYVRKGCSGYLCGNVGMGPFLGSNIMIASYGLPQEGPKENSGFSKLIRDKFVKKIKTSNAEIIAAFKAKGKLTTQKDELDAEVNNINEKMENKYLQGYDSHPLYTESGSIQAHHLICSESVNIAQWRAICKMTGYNINCKRNGVYLPSDMKLACHTELQCHLGGHSRGRSNISKTYVNAVKAKVDTVINTIVINNEDKACQENESSNIIAQLNSISIEILGYLKTYTWTIASDSLNYLPGGIGCANCSKITEKRKTLKGKLTEVVKKDFREQEKSVSLKQIDTVEEITGDNINNFLDLVICRERNKNRKIKPENLELDINNMGESGKYHEEDLKKYGKEKYKSINDYKLEISH